jgi:cell wall-associated NlpC family hydrolase
VSIGSDTTVQPDTRGGLPLSRRALAGVVALVAIVGVAILLLSGGGHSAKAGASGGHGAKGSTASSTASGASARQAAAKGAHATHTGTAGERVGASATGAGASGTSGTKGGASATGGSGTKSAASAGSGKPVAVAEVRDPEESKSFPLPASTHHRAASTPSVAGEAAVAPGAASDAEIRKELGEEEHAKAEEQAAQRHVLTPVAGGFSVGGDGTIPIPSGVPEAVQRVVAGGNAIADFPYIWGGGHASFVANGYDCSGSVSYALAAGGLLSAPLVSGDLAHWGEPGPGRWITIYANAGHTFMNVDGWWFDTAGRSGPYASRWLVSQPSLEGYAVRHPPGL